MTDETCEETGHCALHGIEIERRKGDRRDINSLKEDIKENKSFIGELLTFKNRVLGYTPLILIIILGSYAYINIHSANAEAKYAQYDVEIKSIRNDIAILNSLYARTDERYIAVNTNLNNINIRLTQLIEIMVGKEEAKKEKVIL